MEPANNKARDPETEPRNDASHSRNEQLNVPAPLTAPEESSRLLSLAAELRNEIYSLVLLSPEDVVIPVGGKLASPPLLGVCKQIRDDALQLYYGFNSFRAIVTDSKPFGPVEWLESKTDKPARHIHKLTLEYFMPGGLKGDDVYLFGCYVRSLKRLRENYAWGDVEGAKARDTHERVLREYIESNVSAVLLRFLRLGISVSTLAFYSARAELDLQDGADDREVCMREAACAWVQAYKSCVRRVSRHLAKDKDLRVRSLR